MDKTKILFQCDSCGASFGKWQGNCTVCGEWNTLSEVTETVSSAKTVLHVPSQSVFKTPVPVTDIQVSPEVFLPTGISELDRVLGKGLVKGSVSLLGGEPGIGKSTLALQVAQRLAAMNLKVLYVSGEESVPQVTLRSRRLGPDSPTLFVYSELDIFRIKQAIETVAPDVLVLDSIQVVYHPHVGGVAGSVAQVRQCANELVQLVKSRDMVGLLIGHITKEGQLAGPKVLEHMVDVVMVMEGERNHQYRILRSFKNRYSDTHEIGLFDMKSSGMQGVESPSELFMDETTLQHPGSAVSGIVEGSRVFLVEVQALVVESGFGMAKRTFLGVDTHRANLLIAAVEKILGIGLGSKDIILNIVGGLRIQETALDLAIVAAILSSLNDVALNQRVGVLGEVGLTGEIRPVSHVERRVKEFENMGFTHLVLPERNRLPASVNSKLTIRYIHHIRELLSVI